MILADPNRRQYNEQLKEATNVRQERERRISSAFEKELIFSVLPRYALELVQYMSEQDILAGGIESIQINQHLHARGINVSKRHNFFNFFF
jgi:hypothetical protein